MGIGSPLSRPLPRPSVLCSTTTASRRSRQPRFGLVLTAPEALPFFVSRFRGLHTGRSFPPAPRLLVFRYPLSSGLVPQGRMALPSSRVPPLTACPLLRPRWCPRRSPVGLTPFATRTVAFRPFDSVGFHRSNTCEQLSFVHNYTHFGAQSRGLPSRSPQLRTSRCRASTWGSLLTCWLDFSQVGFEPFGSHPLGNISEFRRISPSPVASGLRLAQRTRS